MKKAEQRSISASVVISICGQIIGLSVFTALARTFPQETLGQYFSFGAISAIIGVVSSLYYEQAIYIVKTNAGIIRIICAVMVVSLIISSAAYILVGSHEIYKYLPITIISAALIKIATSLNIRDGHIKNNALFQSIITPIAPITMLAATWQVEVDVVLMIQISSSTMLLSSLIFFYMVFRKRFSATEFKKITLQKIINGFKKYRNFAYYSAPGELLSTAGLRVPVVIANEYFTSALAAQYGLLVRISLAPIQLIAGVLSQSFLSKYAHAERNGKPRRTVLNEYIKITMLLCLAQAILIISIGEMLIVEIFGDGYRLAGEMLETFVFYLSGLVLVSPLIGTLIVLQRQDLIFLNKLSFFMISAGSFYIAYLLNNFIFGVTLYSSLMGVAYLAILLKLIKVDESHEARGS